MVAVVDDGKSSLELIGLRSVPLPLSQQVIFQAIWTDSDILDALGFIGFNSFICHLPLCEIVNGMSIKYFRKQIIYMQKHKFFTSDTAPPRHLFQGPSFPAGAAGSTIPLSQRLSSLLSGAAGATGSRVPFRWRGVAGARVPPSYPALRAPLAQEYMYVCIFV